MTVASLAVLVLFGQVPATDPFDLIAQLGAPQYAERNAASATLERLGRRALPALRAAREQRDPEVRSRAASLLAKIEGALLTQPSLVTLDFQDTPLPEAVRSFSEQSSVRLVLLGANGPNWRDRKVTLHETEALPFWKAIDRFCDAAHLQYNFGMNAARGGSEPAFPLFEGGVRSSAPVSDSGPFRVTLVTIHHESNVTYPAAPQPIQNPRQPVQADPPRGVLSQQLYAQMQIAVEPRLSLTQSAPLRVVEAEDDRGNQLAPSSGASDLRSSGYFGYSSGPILPIQASLSRPALPGKTIKRLKGVVPVTVSSRKPNPLTVPLSGASGRTFQNDDVVVTVHEARLQQDNRPPVIEVTIRPNTGTGNPSASGVVGGEGIVGRPDVHQQHLEVVDGQGHPIPWYQSSIDTEAGRLTVSLTSDQAASATELRYFSLIRATTEVPFEFTDLRMP